jgi:hypothetical protein
VCKIGNPKISSGDTMPPKNMRNINTTKQPIAMPMGGTMIATPVWYPRRRASLNMPYHVSKNMNTSTIVRTVHAVLDKDFMMS